MAGVFGYMAEKSKRSPAPLDNDAVFSVFLDNFIGTYAKIFIFLVLP